MFVATVKAYGYDGQVCVASSFHLAFTCSNTEPSHIKDIKSVLTMAAYQTLNLTRTRFETEHVFG